MSRYGISPSIANTMDAATRLAVAAGLEAMVQAGLLRGNSPAKEACQLDLPQSPLMLGTLGRPGSCRSTSATLLAWSSPPPSPRSTLSWRPSRNSTKLPSPLQASWMPFKQQPPPPIQQQPSSPSGQPLRLPQRGLRGTPLTTNFSSASWSSPMRSSHRSLVREAPTHRRVLLVLALPRLLQWRRHPPQPQPQSQPTVRIVPCVRI
jgi:hypothetical protein